MLMYISSDVWTCRTKIAFKPRKKTSNRIITAEDYSSLKSKKEKN